MEGKDKGMRRRTTRILGADVSVPLNRAQLIRWYSPPTAKWGQEAGGIGTAPFVFFLGVLSCVERRRRQPEKWFVLWF